MTPPQPDPLGALSFPNSIVKSVGEYQERWIKELNKSASDVATRALRNWQDNVRVLTSSYVDNFKKLVTLRRPANWGEEKVPLPLAELIVTEGIPLAYVPRAAIVAELVAAADYEERAKVLLNHKVEAMCDCRVALVSVNASSEVAEQVPLLVEAITVFESGSYAAAQALAMVVIDTLIAGLGSDSYSTKKTKAAGFDLQVAYLANRYRILLTLRLFETLLTPWHPDNTQLAPPPSKPSRHVTVHRASPAHLHERNAVISVAAATSLLMAFDEWDSVLTPSGTAK